MLSTKFHCQYALVNFIYTWYGSGWSVEVGHKARGAFHISHLSLWSPRNNAENRQSMDDVYNLVIITGQQQSPFLLVKLHILKHCKNIIDFFYCLNECWIKSGHNYYVTSVNSLLMMGRH